MTIPPAVDRASAAVRWGGNAINRNASPHEFPQPILVATGCDDEQGLLVMKDGRLVAVLVHLEDAAHGANRGCWFLEASFGEPSEMAGLIFPGLDEASVWFSNSGIDVACQV